MAGRVTEAGEFRDLLHIASVFPHVVFFFFACTSAAFGSLPCRRGIADGNWAICITPHCGRLEPQGPGEVGGTAGAEERARAMARQVPGGVRLLCLSMVSSSYIGILLHPAWAQMGTAIGL